MAATIRGITIEIGGDTTKLDKALTQVNLSSKNLQSELKQVDKLLKLDPTNTELLAQKQKILKDAIEETSKKLDVLKDAEAQVQKQFEKGEVSEEQYRALKRMIVQTEQELKSLETEAKNVDDTFENLGTEVENTSEDLKKTTSETNSLGEGFGKLKAAAAGVIAALGLKEGAKASVEFSTSVKQALNTVATQTGATVDEMEGLEEIITDIYNDNFGEDLNDIAESMALVKTQTGQTGDQLKTTTENAILFRDTFGVDVEESIRAVNSLMNQFGISSTEAYNLMIQGAQNGLNANQDMCDVINEYAVQYASAGLSAEDMFNMIANGAEVGTWSIDKMGDAFKEFNIRMNDGTANDYLEQLGLNAKEVVNKFQEGGDSAKEAMGQIVTALQNCDDKTTQYTAGVGIMGTMYEDMGLDACMALLETQGEITNTSTALKDLNKTKYDDLNNQFAEVKRNLQTELIKPIGEELTPTISEVLQNVKDNIPQAKEVLSGVIDKVKEFIQFVTSNGPTIISLIAGIATGMLAWNVVTMIQGIIGAIKAWKVATEGLTLSQKILNLVMAANPIGIIITVIASLIAALIVLFNTNEGFRTKVLAVWETVKDAAVKIGSTIVKFFTETLPGAFNKIIDFVKNNWQGLLLFIVNPFAGAFKLLYDNCEGFRVTINTLIENIKTFFQGLWNKIDELFTGVGQWFTDRFTEAYLGITYAFGSIGQWFGERWKDIQVALSTVASWFLMKFQAAFNNIVMVFIYIGAWFAARWREITNALAGVPEWFRATFQGAFDKINSIFGDIKTWFKNRFEEAWKAIKNVFNGDTIKEFFDGVWTTISKSFSKIGTKVGDAIGSEFKTSINAAIKTAENALNKMVNILNGFSVEIGGKRIGFNLSSFDFSKYMLAKGGVLSNGKAIVAEAGPELISMVNGKTIVTPLTQSAKNTAMENLQGGNNHTTSFVQNNNYYSPKALSPSESARMTRNATKNMVLAMMRG